MTVPFSGIGSAMRLGAKLSQVAEPQQYDPYALQFDRTKTELRDPEIHSLLCRGPAPRAVHRIAVPLPDPQYLFRKDGSFGVPPSRVASFSSSAATVGLVKRE